MVVKKEKDSYNEELPLRKRERGKQHLVVTRCSIYTNACMDRDNSTVDRDNQDAFALRWRPTSPASSGSP